MTAGRYRLGVDVGGTHTDLVLYDVTERTLLVEKVASTPHNPAVGVLNGIANFVSRGIDFADIEFFSHGTTITTNALLEMRGAKVGLLITKGYRAVQEVQNQARDGNLFDYFYEKPPPIAPQSLTKEIAERSGLDDFFLHGVRHLVETQSAGLLAPHISHLLFDYAAPRGAGAGYDQHDYRAEMTAAVEAWARLHRGARGARRRHPTLLESGSRSRTGSRYVSPLKTDIGGLASEGMTPSCRS